ncbi:MAG TPA: alpha-hydroxy-acid oxidizing protein [Candidatus Acidoferrum sp.]
MMARARRVFQLSGMMTAGLPLPMNWDFVKRLRDTVTLNLLLKGIVTREDAQLAVEHGIDGLIVSNHGGRADETCFLDKITRSDCRGSALLRLSSCSATWRMPHV